MAVSFQEDEFLEAAVAAIPRIAELIAALPSEDRAGALEMAESSIPAKRRGIRLCRIGGLGIGQPPSCVSCRTG